MRRGIRIKDRRAFLSPNVLTAQTDLLRG